MYPGLLSWTYADAYPDCTLDVQDGVRIAQLDIRMRIRVHIRTDSPIYNFFSKKSEIFVPCPDIRPDAYPGYPISIQDTYPELCPE